MIPKKNDYGAHGPWGALRESEVRFLRTTVKAEPCLDTKMSTFEDCGMILGKRLRIVTQAGLRYAVI